VQLPGNHIASADLEHLAKQCVELLRAGKFEALVKAFGYAVALGRAPASAIAADLQASLSSVGASSLAEGVSLQVAVKYFEPKDGLLGVVECSLPANNGSRVLVELVISEQVGQAHLTLEQVSAAA
jgi:hypothetical protein